MSKGASFLYKRIASLLSDKTETPYSVTMGLIRCKFNFALLRSSILCVRDSGSSRSRPIMEAPILLQVSEGQIMVVK